MKLYDTSRKNSENEAIFLDKSLGRKKHACALMNVAFPGAMAAAQPRKLDTDTGCSLVTSLDCQVIAVLAWY